MHGKGKTEDEAHGIGDRRVAEVSDAEGARGDDRRRDDEVNRSSPHPGRIGEHGGRQNQVRRRDGDQPPEVGWTFEDSGDEDDSAEQGGDRQGSATEPGATLDDEHKAGGGDGGDQQCRGDAGHRVLPRPSSRARTIAADRSATASLPKIEEMWLATVFGERNSSSAMAALRRPEATRSRTSRSRSVS